MAALVKKGKVHSDIFRHLHLDRHPPRSPLMRASPASALSYVHFLHSVHLCDLLCSVPHCLFLLFFPLKQGQQLGLHLFMHSAVQSKEILLNVHRAPLHIHLTQSTLDPLKLNPHPQGNPEPTCPQCTGRLCSCRVWWEGGRLLMVVVGGRG